jgi:ABC-type phosphate transport system substrate-binding protein
MWRILVILISLALVPRANAEPAYVVIVNAKNTSKALDRTTITDMFLKKRTQWSDDLVIQPVDQTRGSQARKQFSEQVLGRSVASVRTYWNRLVFSGRGVPPPELATDDDVVKYVAKHHGAIGYVVGSVNLKDAGVKVIEIR